MNTLPRHPNSYKFSKHLYGRHHPWTIWCRCVSYPYLIPYIVLCLPYHAVRFVSRWIAHRRRRRACGRRVREEFHRYAEAHREERVAERIKPIALYLPQFHRIPENDEWWGAGFTEWTNVKKATPLYAGHYQPHVPHPDIGYYDLADVEVMRRQAAMAKRFGVHGFCFYYYYFARGKRLLEKPIDNWLRATDIDFPFCFAWANENWTRAWDGGDKEVIMPQDYDEANMLGMIREMMPAFRDRRYIRIDNKPVLFVYRAEIVPQVSRLAQKWRAIMLENGFEGIWLISMQHFEQKDPRMMGFDAAAEFAPGSTPSSIPVSPSYYMRHWDEMTKHMFFDIRDVVNYAVETHPRSYPCIRCITPSWDNSPRKAACGAMVVYDASPSVFKDFMVAKIKETALADYPMDGMLLINAWNEWGEGAHLEPDVKNGYRYLDVVRDVCSRSLGEIDCMG